MNWGRGHYGGWGAGEACATPILRAGQPRVSLETLCRVSLETLSLETPENRMSPETCGRWPEMYKSFSPLPLTTGKVRQCVSRDTSPLETLCL